MLGCTSSFTQGGASSLVAFDESGDPTIAAERAEFGINGVGRRLATLAIRSKIDWEVVMAVKRTSFIALPLAMFMSTSAVAVAETPSERRPSPTEGVRAIRFSDAEAAATRELNELVGQGWQYVGPLSNGLVAFRRAASMDAATVSLQGEWEFLSYERDGVVTDYKPEHRLTLSISGDDWVVTDQVRHRVEITGRKLVFHGSDQGLSGFGSAGPQGTVALGMFELKGGALTYCMTPAASESDFASGIFREHSPVSFDTKGTQNVVYRLRRN